MLGRAARALRPGILDRAFVAEVASPFALAVAVFIFFLLLDRLFQLTDLAVTKGVPLHLVLQLLVYLLPAMLVHVLPLALLVAVLMTAGRMAADMEVVALKAAGLGLLRVFRPALTATLLISAVTAGLTLVVVPGANVAFQQHLFSILESRAVAGLKERIFNTSFGDVVVYVEEISASQVALRGLVVSDERDPALSRIVTAREGRLLADPAHRRVLLRMLDGSVNEADVVPVEARAGARSAGGAAGARRYRHTAFRVYDMTLALDSPLKSPRPERGEKDLGTAELRRRLGDPRTADRDRAYLAVEWHKRLAYPLAPLAFLLCGFPLAVRSHRGGRSVALVASLVIAVTHYLLLGSLSDVAVRGQMPPWASVWASNLVIGGAGLALLGVTAREWRPPALRGLWRVLDGLWQRRPRRPRGREARFRAAAPETTLIIDRYLVRRFAAFAALGLVVAAALTILVDLLDILDRLVTRRPPVASVIEYFAYLVPIRLHTALPIVMLVATIFLFLALARWHELTALKAAGVSLYRTSAPILAVAVGVALGSALFQEFLLPVLNERGQEIERVKIKQEALLDLDHNFRVIGRLDARRADWTPAGWQMVDGAFRDFDADGRVTTVPFTRTAVALEETVKDFTDVQKPPGEMSYRELREYVSRLEAAGLKAQKYMVDMYAKLSEPLRNVIMVLVAIPFALLAPRSGRLYGVALAIGILAAYFVVDHVARAFARADLLPPLLAAWTANVIFLGVGSSLFLRART
jgi:LPS export ABC transporter permease LptF